jgi:2-polyprenyl-6-methoxyphenol hydroxylase-like FAD-dependent oxidoreductase
LNVDIIYPFYRVDKSELQRKTASVSQAQLEIILRQHLQEYGCEVEMGMRLNGISQDDSQATATVEVVQSKKEVLIECSYIVAADGAKGETYFFFYRLLSSCVLHQVVPVT